MSPYQIKILLHYHGCCDDYPNNECAPIFEETIGEFVRDGLLELSRTPTGSKYRMTARGDFYCSYLVNVPLPVERWGIP